eukprot:CAMPEP_0201686096 /NCGR_PEP_ID=MMETSP0578-20130828/664_1 /ASSEMBLY_ACC=CAM_ASM_000663 /TAXON_ID=267565 /ORGANISM="Skeletonema grethea, Strain CCMP 1804" /LENGTH=173 /DNA_ID=CAMNT_0048170097 /DNA_START=265 /DNA_END=786 /DNA_ORIENTATION=+
MTRRSPALISGHMKSMPRKYIHSAAITSSLLTINNSALNYYRVARTDNTMVSITYRTKSSKPSFSWEEKRVEVTTPEEFQRRLNRIERLSEEAQLCIHDARESFETEHFEEELHCAEMAVGNAGIAYSELLEELALTNEGVQLLNEVRKVVAPAIESLREELRHIEKLKSTEA